MMPLSPGFFLLGIDQLDPTSYSFLCAGHQPIEESSFLLVSIVKSSLTTHQLSQDRHLCQTSWWDQMFVVNSQTGVAVNLPELTFQEWPQCSVPWFIEICYGARVSLVDSLTENHAATYNMRKRCQVYGDTFCSSCRYVRPFLTGDTTLIGAL